VYWRRSNRTEDDASDKRGIARLGLDGKVKTFSQANSNTKWVSCSVEMKMGVPHPLKLNLGFAIADKLVTRLVAPYWSSNER